MSTTIMRFEYGSRAHGTHTPQSDRDVMQIDIEDAAAVTGIDSVSTKVTGTAEDGARSGSEDTDTTTYPLRKWAALAAKGNPTVLTALFAPEYDVLTEAGQRILDVREAFLSRSAGVAFLGYMNSQRLAMTGMRSKRTNRPELVHTYGYDTKFAYHMLRLGYEGIEFMRDHTITLSLPDATVEVLLSVRSGRLDKQEVLDLGAALDVELQEAIAASILPERADRWYINDTLHHIYLDEWIIR